MRLRNLPVVVALLTMAACAEAPLSSAEPAQPQLVTVTYQGLTLSYPGLAFGPTNGGQTVTCNYVVTVKNRTGQTLSGYVYVHAPSGDAPLTSYSISNHEMLPINTTTPITVSVTGTSAGFYAVLEFTWADGLGSVWKPVTTTYCSESPY